jgi:hypothetical protein
LRDATDLLGKANVVPVGPVEGWPRFFGASAFGTERGLLKRDEGQSNNRSRQNEIENCGPRRQFHGLDHAAIGQGCLGHGNGQGQPAHLALVDSLHFKHRRCSTVMHLLATPGRLVTAPEVDPALRRAARRVPDSQKKSRPERGGWGPDLLVPLIVSCVSGYVPDVARDFVRGALGLVDLAFCLELLVTGQLAGCFLDGALHLVGGA